MAANVMNGTTFRKCHLAQCGDCNCPWPCPKRIIYVDDDANGLNDGSSWQNAYQFLQDALMMAREGDELRVAQGIYKPDDFALSDRPNLGRAETFQLINGVAIRGGYAGIGAPDPNARDIQLYKTILSGDLNGNDVEVANPWNPWNPPYEPPADWDLLGEPTRAENSYHVVTGSVTDANAVLDGFTVIAGNANSGTEQQEGAGIYNDNGRPTITNCTFKGNAAGWFGAAMYNNCGSPTLTNCTFKDNWAREGAGIYNWQSNPTVDNCIFTKNMGHKGAGMYNHKSSPIVTNCTFNYNTVYWHDSGGGMYNHWHSNPTISNCTFDYNWAEYFGGAIYCNENSCPTIRYCTVSRNYLYWDGAGIYCQEGSSPTIKNCLIVNNNTDEGFGGGVVCVQASCPTIINCIITDNDGWYADALYADDRSIPVIKNCIVWESCLFGGSALITYSCIQGGWPGEGNIDTDPCFVEPRDWTWPPVQGDHHLKSQAGRWDPNSKTWVIDDVTSPCIDAGDPASPIGYEPFPNGGIINMGAFGGTREASKSYFGEPICETIIAGDINGDCKIDLWDLALMTSHWLEEH
jgi:predicted outer membrane repeat protein